MEVCGIAFGRRAASAAHLADGVRVLHASRRDRQLVARAREPLLCSPVAVLPAPVAQLRESPELPSIP